MAKKVRSRVHTSRRFEVYCETHGVLESSRAYDVAKRAREQHRAESPECFHMPSMMPDTSPENDG